MADTRSPSRLLAEMVVDQKMSRGDAVRALQDRYNAGDQEVKGLPGMEEFAGKYFKSRIENAMERGVIGIAKVPAYVGSFVSDDANDLLGELRQEEEMLPKDMVAELGGAMLSDTVLLPIAAPIAGALKVSAGARLLGRMLAGRSARQAVDLGLGLTDIVPGALRGITLGGVATKAATTGGEFAILEKMKGESAQSAAITGVVTAATVGLGGAASKKLGQMVGYDPIKRAIEHVARAKGTSKEEIMATFDNAFQLRTEIKDYNLLKEVDFAINEDALKESAKFYKPHEASPQMLDMPPPPPPRVPTQFEKLKANELPTNSPDNVEVFGYELPQRAGGRFIVTPVSRMLGSKMSSIIRGNPVAKLVRKPLVVDYDPRLETGALASIKQLYTDPKVQARVLGVFSSGIMPERSILYNDVINEFVARKAVERGYGSIIQRGTTGLDDIVVDLHGFKSQGVGNIEQVVENVKNSILAGFEAESGAGGVAKSAEKTKASLAALLGLGIGGAATLLEPDQAEAAPISVTALRELAERLGLKTAEGLKDAVGSEIFDSNPIITKGTQWAIDYIHAFSKKLPFPATAEDIINELDDVITKVKIPKEPKVDVYLRSSLPNNVIGNEYTIDISHPDVDIPVMKVYATQPHGSDTLKVDIADGIGPSALGAKFLKQAMHQVAEQLPSVKKIDPGTRVTGTGEKYGIIRKGGIIKLAAIPLAIGSTLIPLTPEESDAGVISNATRKVLSGVGVKIAKEGLADIEKGAINSTSERLAMAMDSDPAAILGPDYKRFTSWITSERNWGAGSIRNMADGSDHPTWIAKFVVPNLDAKEKYQLRMMRDYRIKSDKLLAETGIKEQDFDDVLAHLEGLDVLEGGGYRQTRKYLTGDRKYNEKLDQAAQRIRREIVDPLFQEIKGVDPRYNPILKRFGIEDTPENLRALKLFQDVEEQAGGDPFKMVLPPELASHVRGKVEVYRGASKALKGMLNFDDTHDLLAKPFEGNFSFQPLVGEKGAIQDKIRDLTKMYATGGVMPPDKQTLINDLTSRLNDLDKMEKQLGGPKIQGVVPRNKYFGPTSTGKKLGMMTDTDPRKAIERYIGGALSKRRFDVTFSAFRSFKKEAEAEDLHDLVALGTQWLDAMRGGRMREDLAVQGIASAYTSLTKGRKATLGEIREGFDTILTLQYYAKLGMLPIRFPLTNMTQTIITTLPVAGPTATLSGITQALTREGWEHAAKHVDLLSSSIAADEISMNVGMWSPRRIADWLPGKTEDLNRAIAFHAGRQQFLDTIARGGKLSRVVKTFVPRKGLTVSEQADEYGKAFVRATQFIRGAEGRPLATVGSGVRTLAGQFKTFPTSYVVLMKDITRLAMTGDKEAQKMLARALPALFTVGGMTASTGLAVGIPIYDIVNRALVQAGHGPLPDKSGIGYAADALGLYDPLDGNPALEQVRQFMGSIDISQGVNPFNFPQARLADGLDTSSEVREQFIYDLGRFVAGPTYSGALEAGVEGLSRVGDIFGAKQETVRDDRSKINEAFRKIKPFAGIVSPFGSSIMEAGQELLEGGVYTQAGDLIAQRSGAQILSRALNLSPSMMSVRYRALKDMEFALVNNRPELIPAIQKNARQLGLIFTKRTMTALRSRVSKARKAQARGRD